MLATRCGLGSLDRVRRVIKVFGMVNCVPDFQQHPAVINGCSELFAEVFGTEHGVGGTQCDWRGVAACGHDRGNRGHLRSGAESP